MADGSALATDAGTAKHSDPSVGIVVRGDAELEKGMRLYIGPV